VMELPVLVASSGNCLSIRYQISSPRAELEVHVYATYDNDFSLVRSLSYNDQNHIGEWNKKKIRLYYGVVAVRLIAVKTGVTTNAEYVLVDNVGLQYCYHAGGDVYQSPCCCVRELTCT